MYIQYVRMGCEVYCTVRRVRVVRVRVSAGGGGRGTTDTRYQSRRVTLNDKTLSYI